MKHQRIAVTNCTGTTVANSSRFFTAHVMMIFSALLLFTVLFASCKKENVENPKINTSAVEESMDMESLATSSITAQELKLAKQATARYQSLDSAIKDGYIDINVIMPNMGYHYQKPELVDSVFDIEHPELLVYNKDKEGNFKLVAIEYAIPLDQSVNAPKGFTGKRDVWTASSDFGLWLLHAWVWKYNPDGVFNPTNPLVHVDGAMDMP